MSDSDSVLDVLAELDARIQELENLPHPDLRELVFHVLQLVDRAHRPGITALAERLREAGLFEDLLDDESVHALFALYELLPVGEDDQRPLVQLGSR